MNDQSRMYGQLNLWDIPNAISSPELASGPSPCDKPDGPMTRRFGQDHALASLSARQAKEAGLLTSGTSGPRFTFLSSSASLQSSLASRLQAATAMLGSTLYRMTWKQRVMPSGRLKPSLAASALRTSDPEITGWPTPRAADSQGGVEPDGATGRKLFTLAAKAAWPTPTVGNANGSQMAKGASATGRRSDGSKATVSLNAVVRLTGWHTPLARDGDKLDATPPAIEKRMRDGREIGTAMEARMTSDHGWSQHPGPARLMATGEMLTGSDAQTKSGGQLNPAHSLWLMLGPFATAWASCGERVMRSRSGKRKVSSKP